jgi:hypothetical protein
MDETTARQLAAAIVNATAIHSGGGMWLVRVHRIDGSFVVINDAAIAVYPDADSLTFGKPSTFINLD